RGPPVLALPERVQLPVVQKPVAVVVAARRVQAGALLLKLALLGLALHLGVVLTLRASDPPSEQRDRVDLAVDLGQLVLHRYRRADLAGRHPLVGLEGDGRGADGVAVLLRDLERLRVTVPAV